MAFESFGSVMLLSFIIWNCNRDEGVGGGCMVSAVEWRHDEAMVRVVDMGGSSDFF